MHIMGEPLGSTHLLIAVSNIIQVNIEWTVEREGR